MPIFGSCCQIIVLGVSLNYFRYKGNFLNEYYFHNSSVNKAEILPTTSRYKRVTCWLYKLLRELSSSMKILTTSSLSFQVVQTNASELVAQMPLFSNLATLILEEKQVNIGCKGLLRMFQNCPCLQTLVFREGIKLSSNDAEDDGVLEDLEPSPLVP